MRIRNIMERALKLVVIEMIGLAMASVEIFGSPLPQQPVPRARDGPEGQAQLQQLVAPISLYPDELVGQGGGFHGGGFRSGGIHDGRGFHGFGRHR